MNITVTINTDNDAFERDYFREIERLLIEAATRFKRELSNGIGVFKLQDVNGNTVGQVEAKEDGYSLGDRDGFTQAELNADIAARGRK